MFRWLVSARPGVRAAHFRRIMGFRFIIYSRFMAVYADLFYTKLLILLELLRFG